MGDRALLMEHGRPLVFTTMWREAEVTGTKPLYQSTGYDWRTVAMFEAISGPEVRTISLVGEFITIEVGG